MAAKPEEPSRRPRAFGSEASDLACVIDARRPAEAVDNLLCACCGEAPETVRRWSVARRLDALVGIRQAEGRTAEMVTVCCPVCEAPFEIEIDLGACRLPVSEANVVFEVDGRTVEARVPTGAEQARWQRERTTWRRAAASLLHADLSSREEPDDRMLAALDAALAARDPLRDLALRPDCPECGASIEHALDLEAHLVGCFSRRQREWLEEIATLALAYHWSETEIAAMPAWRRSFYLDRLEA